MGDTVKRIEEIQMALDYVNLAIENIDYITLLTNDKDKEYESLKAIKNIVSASLGTYPYNKLPRIHE